VSRATFKCRVISTELSADLGRAFASAKHGACCALSVERIAFSVLMSELTIGVVHFDNSMPLRLHKTRETRSNDPLPQCQRHGSHRTLAPRFRDPGSLWGLRGLSASQDVPRSR
jgi:hypothetical protein